MIFRHSTLSERYMRSLPLIGLLFLHLQSKRHLMMAKKEDLAFLYLMRQLEKEPEESLLNQNLILEYRLIIASFLSISIVWVVSYILLSNQNYIFIYILAMCNAYCIEWVTLYMVTKLSFRVK